MAVIRFVGLIVEFTDAPRRRFLADTVAIVS
jgi:hypothetical protein